MMYEDAMMLSDMEPTEMGLNQNMEQGLGQDPMAQGMDPVADPMMMQQEPQISQAESVLDPDDSEMHEALKQLVQRRMANRIDASRRFQEKARQLNEQMGQGR